MACLPAIGVRHPAVVGDLAAAVVSRVDDAPPSLAGRLHLELAMINLDMPNNVRHRTAAADRRGHRRPPRRRGLGASGRRQAALEDPTRERIDVLRSTPAIASHAIGEQPHLPMPHWLGSALLERRRPPRGGVRALGAREESNRVQAVQRHVLVRGGAARPGARRCRSAGAALDGPKRFAVEVRDPRSRPASDLARTELAAYAGKPWPVHDLEAELGRRTRRAATRWRRVPCGGARPSAASSTDSRRPIADLIGPSVGESRWPCIALGRDRLRRAGARHALG